MGIVVSTTLRTSLADEAALAIGATHLRLWTLSIVGNAHPDAVGGGRNTVAAVSAVVDAGARAADPVEIADLATEAFAIQWDAGAGGGLVGCPAFGAAAAVVDAGAGVGLLIEQAGFAMETLNPVGIAGAEIAIAAIAEAFVLVVDTGAVDTGLAFTGAFILVIDTGEVHAGFARASAILIAQAALVAHSAGVLAGVVRTTHLRR